VLHKLFLNERSELFREIFFSLIGKDFFILKIRILISLRSPLSRRKKTILKNLLWCISHFSAWEKSFLIYFAFFFYEERKIDSYSPDFFKKKFL